MCLCISSYFFAFLCLLSFCVFHCISWYLCVFLGIACISCYFLVFTEVKRLLYLQRVDLHLPGYGFISRGLLFALFPAIVFSVIFATIFNGFSVEAEGKVSKCTSGWRRIGQTVVMHSAI